MRLIQVYKNKALLDNDSKAVHHRPNMHGAKRCVQVKIPDFIGEFHEFVTIADAEGLAYAAALVEDKRGSVHELPLNFVQFMNTTHKHYMATHVEKLSNTVKYFYRYGENNKAQALLASGWGKAHKVTNYDLYSQKDKYIPI